MLPAAYNPLPDTTAGPQQPGQIKGTRRDYRV